METYDWIQILALVAVLVYSGWLASRKGTQKKSNNGAPKMGRQMKDSPAYGPETDMPKPYPAVDSVDTVQVEKGLEEDTYRAYQTVQSADGAELLPSEGVAMISTKAGENQEPVVGSAMSGAYTTGNGAVNPLPDLRTMVISSEILKPKYEEY